jgi:site-specific DNA-methyltransferase (adenine-specific)
MDEFKNKIICGDCIELLCDKEPFADLIFADPPFNIGYKYDKYKDCKKTEHYIEWSENWMRACSNVLKPHGSFYIAIGDDYAAHIRLIGEKLGLHLRNWIIWHYTFGQQTKMKFARAHTHIFYFVKDKDNFTFNDHSIRVPSDRQLLYNDKRANKRGKMPDDVWNTFPRVCGTFKERQGWHPCQMPKSVLMRIVAVSSNRGDLVFDPFSGSGTTAVAAGLLERNYCGMDISEDYVDNCNKRLVEVEAQRKAYNGKLSHLQMMEMVRLLDDMGKSAAQILDDSLLFKYFFSQFCQRVGEQVGFGDDVVECALQELAN